MTWVEAAPGASVTIPVGFSVDGLAPGEYEGFIQVQGARSNVTSVVMIGRSIKMRETCMASSLSVQLPRPL